MPFMGAAPDDLSNLGQTLKNQITPIDTVISTVTSVLNGTNWTGPAHDQFAEEWNGSFRSALDRLKSAFEAAGNDCVRRAGDLAVAMGRR
jgi:hypothetical protein